MTIILFPLLLLLPLYLFSFIKHSLSSINGNGNGKNLNNLPPGPNAILNLANISRFLKTPHIAHKNLAKIYGPLTSFRVGAQLVVVVSSPDFASEILKTQNRIFSGRYMPSIHYKVPGLPQASIVASWDCGPTWKFLRAIGHSSIFSPTAVESASEMRKEKVMEMVEFLRTDKKGKAVNIEHVVFAALINFMSNVLGSRNMFSNGAESDSDQMLMSFINDIVDSSNNFSLTDLFPFLKGLDFWSKSRARNFDRKLKLIWADAVKERKANGPNSRHDFMDILIENSFTDDQMCISLTELLIAGTDSTTITVVWMMAELIKNPKILDQLRNEIATIAVDDGNLIKESCLSDCQYFQACIKETLRLHIPGPFTVPHRATEACRLKDYVIPKDSVVLVNAWAIHTNPEYWEEPMVFEPDRFLNSEIDYKDPQFRYFPFSGGSRMCPGSVVALRGLQLVMASLVHYFDWRLPDGQDPCELDMTGTFRTTLRKDKPLYLIPTPRPKWVAN